jgi:antitoxin (DNA-binding transcriptional repressor) of toxin-antitoxin stability system
MDKELAIDGKHELEELVDAVEAGESVALTRGGNVVGSFERARPKVYDDLSPDAILERVRSLRRGQVLRPHPTIKEMLDESRGR